MDLMTLALTLDFVLVAGLLLQAVVGWRRGFLASVLGVVGLIAGGWLALFGLPLVMAPSAAVRDNPLVRSIVLVIGVGLVAVIGYSVLSDVGHRIMAKRGAVASRWNSALGAVVSAGMATVLLGLASIALYPMAPSSWRAMMDESRVVSTLSDRMPPVVVEGAARATESLYQAGFPRVFGDPGAEPDLPAERPDGSTTGTDQVRAAAGSVVKVNSSMPSCNAAGTGSGWVVAPQRIVTNAHVVAGADAVSVQVGGTGQRLRATVVAFDPARDLAILAVPRLQAPALHRSGPLSPGDSAVVAGFPRGGPYRTEPARIRGTVDAAGTDIYDQRPVQREIYSIYSAVYPGNSGGPLLTPDGRVAGTVFARSSVSPDTGFVLTDANGNDLLDRAPRLTQAVSTQSCASA